jgi:hypothetical protein
MGASLQSQSRSRHGRSSSTLMEASPSTSRKQQLRPPSKWSDHPASKPLHGLRAPLFQFSGPLRRSSAIEPGVLSQSGHFEAVQSSLRTSNSPSKSPSNFEELRAFRSSLERGAWTPSHPHMVFGGALRLISTLLASANPSFSFLALQPEFRSTSKLEPVSNFEASFETLSWALPFHAWSRLHSFVTSRLLRSTSDITSPCQVPFLVFHSVPRLDLASKSA